DDELEPHPAVAAQHELQAHAGVGGHRRPVAAAQQLVGRYAEDLALQVEQGHLDGGAGEGGAERGLLQLAGDPFAVERVGPDEQGRERLADEGDAAGLALAAPDGGDAGLAKADVAGLVGDAHQDVVATTCSPSDETMAISRLTLPSIGSAETTVIGMDWFL